MVSPRKQQQQQQQQQRPQEGSTPQQQPHVISILPSHIRQQQQQQQLNPPQISKPKGKNTNAGTSSQRPRKFAKVFAKKKFYLDIKSRTISSAKIRQLIDDLQALGGVIEEFFSKEITHVVTDAPEWKLKNPLGAPDNVSPGTPCSLGAIANSPWSPVTSAANSNKKSWSRVDTILARARQQAKGTSDVIENAHKWGLKIWSVHKVFAWVDNHKKEVGGFTHKRSHSVEYPTAPDQQPHVGCRPLRVPFLKYEAHQSSQSSNHQLYKPVFAEYRKFPNLYLTGKAGTSPFYAPERYAETSKAKANNKKRKLELRDLSNGREVKSRKRQKTEKGANNQQQQQQQQQQQHQQNHKKGFCEICEKSFDDLQQHVDSRTHQHVVKVDSYWAKVDLAIGFANMNSDDSVYCLSDPRE